nr:HK97-gp10 family putative phage morphogenesis protein [uncultured Brevundimonas sp.]
MAGFGDGKRRLSKKMAAVPKEVRKALRAQNKANANELVDTMRGFAPVRDGALVTSIKGKDVSNSQRISQRVKAGGQQTTKAVRKSAKGTAPDYDYALAVEYGTEDMAAQPFFWPAWRLKRRRFKSRMSRAAKKAIKAATT